MAERGRVRTGRRGLAALLFCAAAIGAHGAANAADAQPAAADPVLEARVLSIAAELRCLVCQNQTIADSHADLAQDLRRQVREMLQRGQSEREIIDYMTARYGDFVLYRPPLKARTLLLWAGPALLVLAGVGLLVWNLRRRPATAALSEQERQRAAALLER